MIESYPIKINDWTQDKGYTFEIEKDDKIETHKFIGFEPGNLTSFYTQLIKSQLIVATAPASVPVSTDSAPVPVSTDSAPAHVIDTATAPVIDTATDSDSDPEINIDNFAIPLTIDNTTLMSYIVSLKENDGLYFNCKYRVDQNNELKKLYVRYIDDDKYMLYDATKINRKKPIENKYMTIEDLEEYIKNIYNIIFITIKNEPSIT